MDLKIINNKYLFCLIYNIITKFDHLSFEKNFKDKEYYRIFIDSLRMPFFDDDHYKIYYKYIKEGLIGIDKNGKYVLFVFSKGFDNTKGKELIYKIFNNLVHDDKWSKINEIYIIFETYKLDQNVYNEIDEHGNIINILNEKDLIIDYINQCKEYNERSIYHKNIRYNLHNKIPILI